METDETNSKQEEQQNQRPLLVWAISLIYGFSALSEIIEDVGLFLLGESGPEILQHNIPSLSWVSDVSSLGINILMVVAAFSLYKMQTRAVPLFNAYMVLSLLSSLWMIFSTNWYELFGNTAVQVISLSFGITVLIVVYVNRLGKQGILT